MHASTCQKYLCLEGHYYPIQHSSLLIGESIIPDGEGKLKLMPLKAHAYTRTVLHNCHERVFFSSFARRLLKKIQRTFNCIPGGYIPFIFFSTKHIASFSSLDLIKIFPVTKEGPSNPFHDDRSQTALMLVSAALLDAALCFLAWGRFFRIRAFKV